VQRQHERSRSEQQLAIQIACGHGNWVHNGLTWPRTARRRNLLPTQPPAGRSPQRPHPPARWSSPLTYPIAGRITQPPPAQPRITFQRDLASDASGRRHQRRCMTNPATRAVRPRSPAQILVGHDHQNTKQINKKRAQFPRMCRSGVDRRHLPNGLLGCALSSSRIRLACTAKRHPMLAKTRSRQRPCASVGRDLLVAADGTG
jgi:hypothetical protein